MVNARKQFSDVNGPPAWKHGRNSVDQLSVNDPRFGRASRLVDEYLPQRAAGTPSSVGDHLNYANRDYSTPNNYGWIDKLQGPKFGGHKHGTTADLERFRPGDFGVGLPKETVPPGLDMTTTGSIAAQQAQEQAQQAVQEQIEAQKRLAEQMAATQQATQSMQLPIQNIGNRLVTKIKKSGDEVEVSIPIHPEFQAVLDTIKHGHLNFITTERGAARSEKAFTNWIIEAAKDAGLPPHRSPHGLRKSACIRLAEAGCSASQIMAVTGHRNLAEVETYVREANKKKLTDEAYTKTYGAA